MTGEGDRRVPETRSVTKAINLQIEHEHEQLACDAIARIRTGGPVFRAALRTLLEGDHAAENVPAQETEARFAEIGKRILAEQDREERALAAEVIEARFGEAEARLAEMDRRLRDAETLAFERITRLGADSCGG